MSELKSVGQSGKTMHTAERGRDVTSRVPNELLSDIFEHAVILWESDIKREDDKEWISLWSCLNTLSLVCRRWRDVAVRTPRLWRNIWHGPRVGAWMSAYHFQMCLERSLAAPLNIWAHGSDEVVEVIEALSTRDVCRIETLHLSVDDSALPQNANESLRAVLRKSAGQVHRLWLESCIVDQRSFVEILARCSTVETLGVSKATIFPRHELANPVLLPILQELEVSQRSISDLHAVFSVLLAPKLDRLIIDWDSEYGFYDDIGRTLDLGCPPEALNSVRHLFLGGALRSEDVLHILRHTPFIEEFGLFLCATLQEDYDDLLDALRGLEDGTCPLMRMHTFSIHELYVSANALEGFIRSRCFPFSAPLLHLGLSGCWSNGLLHEHELEHLKDMVEVFDWDPPGMHQTTFTRSV